MLKGTNIYLVARAQTWEPPLNSISSSPLHPQLSHRSWLWPLGTSLLPPPRLRAIFLQVDALNSPLGEPLLLTLTTSPSFIWIPAQDGPFQSWTSSRHHFHPKAPSGPDHTLDCSPGPRSPYLSSPHLLPNNPNHDGLLCSLRFGPVSLPWLLKYATVILTFQRVSVSLSQDIWVTGIFRYSVLSSNATPSF